MQNSSEPSVLLRGGAPILICFKGHAGGGRGKLNYRIERGCAHGR